MGRFNFNEAPQFDPAIYRNPAAGGLLGLLQAIARPNPGQVGAAAGSTGTGENSYGSPQGDLIARLAALQANYQQHSFVDGRALPASQNANLEQSSPNSVVDGPQVDNGPNQPSPAMRADGGPSQATLSGSEALPLRFVSRRVDPPFTTQGGAPLANGSAEAGADPTTTGTLPINDGSPRAYSDKPAPPQTTAPSTRTAQIAIPLPRPGVPIPVPPIPMPSIPRWWNDVWKALQLYPMIAAKRPRSGEGEDDRSRCDKAAEGTADDWERFCDALPLAQNLVVGGQSQKKACHSKLFESKQNKLNWCRNQFGDEELR